MDTKEAIKILRKAKEIERNMKGSSIWNEIINQLNKTNIDYNKWTDIDILIWGLENFFSFS